MRMEERGRSIRRSFDYGILPKNLIVMGTARSPIRLLSHSVGLFTLWRALPVAQSALRYVQQLLGQIDKPPSRPTDRPPAPVPVIHPPRPPPSTATDGFSGNAKPSFDDDRKHLPAARCPLPAARPMIQQQWQRANERVSE